MAKLVVRGKVIYIERGSAKDAFKQAEANIVSTVKENTSDLFKVLDANLSTIVFNDSFEFTLTLTVAGQVDFGPVNELIDRVDAGLHENLLVEALAVEYPTKNGIDRINNITDEVQSLNFMVLQGNRNNNGNTPVLLVNHTDKTFERGYKSTIDIPKYTPIIEIKAFYDSLHELEDNGYEEI